MFPQHTLLQNSPILFKNSTISKYLKKKCFYRFKTLKVKEKIEFKKIEFFEQNCYFVTVCYQAYFATVVLI